MLSRAFGIEATFPGLDQLATSAEQKGGPFFSVDECVVVQNESHQNLTESIFHDSNRIENENWWFLIGSNKKTHTFLGIPNPIANPGFNQSCRLKRWIFSHPTASHLHLKSGFQPESLQFFMRFSNFCPDSTLQTWDFEAPTW